MVLDCHYYAFQQTWAFIQKLLSRQKIYIKTLRALSSAPLPFLRSDKLFQHYEHLNIYMPLSISKLHLIQLKRQQKQFKNSLHPLPPCAPYVINNGHLCKRQPFQNALTKLGHYWGYPERETVKPMQSRE